MRRSFSTSPSACFLQASVLIGLAVVLLAMLAHRGGSSEESAAHSAGLGNSPMVTSNITLKNDHRASGK
jgi:hypothetical protein